MKRAITAVNNKKIIEKISKNKNFKIIFNNITNVKLNNELIIADIYDLGEENLKYGMYLFTDIFWDKIKESLKKIRPNFEYIYKCFGN